MSSHRFLVIGAGSIGRRHARNLLELGEQDVIVHDPVGERRAQIERELGLETVAELPAAWSHDPSVALITAPTSIHVPLAGEAVAHGCHCFVEKPLGDSLDGVADVVRAAEERDLVSLVGCNMRFHPGVRALKTLVEEGTLGTILSARFEVGQYLPDWRPAIDYRTSYSAQRALGGGIILDAIHELDYARWLLGEVSDVACFADHVSSLEIDTEDVASILLRFESGAIAETHLDYVQRSYSRGTKLIGELGTAQWDYGKSELDLFTVADGVTAVPLFESWEPNEMYLDELRHFLRCLAGEERPLTDMADGARTLALALAAKESAATGRAVSPSSLLHRP